MTERTVVAARFVEIFPDGSIKKWGWVPMEHPESKALSIMREIRPSPNTGTPIKIQLAVAEEVMRD